MMPEMEQPLPKSQPSRAKEGAPRKSREVGRKGSNRGLIFLVVLALTVIAMKDNLVDLDQFLVAFNTNGQFAPLSHVNGTHEDKGNDLERRTSSSSSSLVSKQSTTYPPLSCTDIFYEDRNEPRPFGDPNQGGMYARYIKSKPSFWTSLHTRKFDPTRWSIMVYGYYYESIQSQRFMDIVKADAQHRRKQQQEQHIAPQPIRVIDVGGNIGWYSLVTIAAARGEDYPIVVDVFEPNPRNHPRLCESLFLNEWLRHDQVAVNLYPVGVTSNQMVGKSPQGRMDLSTSGTGSLEAMNRENLTGTKTFPLVSLDQMANELDWNETISILKVDVEGFELEVFQGAQKLLKSKIVQNIFFEGNMRHKKEEVKFQKIARVLLNCGYVAYMIGGFRGPTEMVKSVWNASLSADQGPKARTVSLTLYMESLLIECAGRRNQKRQQCNMWWRPQ